mgnify:CR=1 FL=1
MQKNIRKFVSISLTAAALAVSTLASAATDLTGKSWSEIEDLAKKGESHRKCMVFTTSIP